MTHRCEVCASPILDTAYVCAVCSGHTASRLRAAADNFAEMHIAIARRDRFGETIRFSRTVAPLPFDQAAAIDYEAVVNTVTVWGHHVCTLRGVPGPGRGNNPLLWIAGQLEWLRYRQEAATALDELDYAARLVERAIDAPAQHWFAGRCLDNGCQAELYARHGAHTIRCRDCGTQHDAEVRKAWLLEQAEDTLGTATEISRLVSAMNARLLTSSQVRGMAHRGRITAHGEDRHGHPTYRVGDVLAALSNSATAR